MSISEKQLNDFCKHRCENWCTELCDTCISFDENNTTYIKNYKSKTIKDINDNSYTDCYSYMKDKMTESLDLYKRKNETYGDSFGKSIEKYGFIAGLTRISDKFNRAENLILGAANKVPDESLSDTLVDMSNYCLMLSYEIEKRKEK